MNTEKIEMMDVKLHTECTECGRVRNKFIQIEADDFDTLCDREPEDNYIDSEGTPHRHVYDTCSACNYA